MLHLKTDKKEVLKVTHPCRCPKCEHPCKYGSGALGDEDLKRLSEFLDISEEEAKERYLEEIEKFNTKRLRPKIEREEGKPYGKCIFYDDTKGCTVHPAKPLECKLAMGCKDYGPELIRWFEMNYYLDPDDPESIRQYKVYVDSGGDVLPGAEIENITTREELEKALRYEDLKISEDWEQKLGLKEDDKNE